MTTMKKDAFYWRAFVTFYIVLSFVVIAASGFVLYISPPGRVANWSQWTLGGLRKADWQAIHTVFTFLFVGAAGVHVYFNWRVIIAYLKSKLGDGIRRRRELALASGLAAAVLALTLGGLPPFGTVMTYGEALKNSWSNPATEPPVPHAELWTVAKFAESTKVPVSTALDNLKQAGMPAEGPETTLQVIAAKNKVTPREVYAKALGAAKPAAVPLAEGGGYGQKTVQQIAEQVNVPLATAIDRLRQAGIDDAAADSNVRELATTHGRRPFEVAQIIQGTAGTL
jgi:hypothetical protein